MAIYFYNEREQPYGCFSNSSPHGFRLSQRWWPTGEHYIQAQKFAGTRHSEAIYQAKTARQAIALSRTCARLCRADWEQVRDDIVARALRYKFAAHDELRNCLLATGEELLIYNAPHEYYWGCGRDNSGSNRLGHLLMTVRASLRAE